MQEHTISRNNHKFRLYKSSVLIVGSGAAGYKAAEVLSQLGHKDVVLVAPNLQSGTSRNSGSDKQTYYKLSLASDTTDSIAAMAQDLMDGGSVDGDIAYCEAAGSVRAFMRLVELGVGFPSNEYGEFVGYKTDHDPRQRATSSGPLTSHDMTISLENSVKSQNIVSLLDGILIFELLTDNNKITGAVGLDLNKISDIDKRIVVFQTEHIILATGGTAAAYSKVVYPHSQHGMMGMAIRIGAQAQNLQEWQYGLASTKFRWNVSGTYQQVLPRYISVDEAGNEYEFLDEYLDASTKLLYTFLKGYQWPFDSKKVDGSSLIDLLITQENDVRKRKVYMDFRSNPSGMEKNFSNVPDEAREYIINSEALQSTPYLRLQHMNPAAIELYRNNGIDLETEMLEVKVCAQHINGGLSVDTNWHTTIPGLYCVGEAAGTFGVTRPGGSALNSGQVGATRAAEHIHYQTIDKLDKDFSEHCLQLIDKAAEMIRIWKSDETSNIAKSYRQQMSEIAAHIRDLEAINRLINDIESEKPDAKAKDGLVYSLIERDNRLTQRALLESMRYAAVEFGSRGSSLVFEKSPDLSALLQSEPSTWGYLEENSTGREQILTCQYSAIENSFTTKTRPVRRLPTPDQWFENIWKNFQTRRTKQKYNKDGGENNKDRSQEVQGNR